MSPTLSTNRMALKEWAIVVEALRRGQQRILLRKGGISEGPGGFQVEHNEFWLFPTQFHQTADQLRIDLKDQLPEVPMPPMGRVQIDVYAVTTKVEFVQNEDEILARVPDQILSEQTVRDRFHYRRPGLFVLTLDLFRLESKVTLEDLPEYGGCHSWVPLQEEIATAGLRTVQE